VHLHYVPQALPFARRPVPGELRTGWLHRVAAANGITFMKLLAGLATRLPADVPATVWVDETLPPTVCPQLAAWCRLDPAALMMLDVSRRYPLAAAAVWTFDPDIWWHERPLTLEPSVRLAFCAHCCREQCHRGEPVHIRAEWALAWLTHCPRHRTWLLNDCFRCMWTGVLDFTAARHAQLHVGTAAPPSTCRSSLPNQQAWTTCSGCNARYSRARKERRSMRRESGRAPR
jgi:hypothetical protein